MSAIQALATILGVVATLFSIVGSLYKFVGWLRRRQQPPEVLDALPADGLPPLVLPVTPRRSRWPWVIGGVILLLWVTFFGLVALGMIYPPPPPPPPPDPTPPIKVTPAVLQPVQGINLTGNWREDGMINYVVSITHQGNDVTMHAPGVGTLTGAAVSSGDPMYPLYVRLGNGVFATEYLVAADGKQMVGRASNGLGSIFRRQ